MRVGDLATNGCAGASGSRIRARVPELDAKRDTQTAQNFFLDGCYGTL